MKSAFTLIEVSMSIILLAILFTASIKGIKYLYETNFIIEIRYLALNRIDSEVARVVSYYKKSSGNEISGNILTPFKVVEGGTDFLIYPIAKIIEVGGDNTNGLKIESNRNIVEIKNIDSEGKILNGDIVGLLGWRSNGNGNEFNLSVAITYPFRYKNNSLEKVLSFTETINIKTSIVK